MSERTKQSDLKEIEETQAALRKSIERAKQLTAQSERLIKQHREEKMDGGPEKAGVQRRSEAAARGRDLFSASDWREKGTGKHPRGSLP